ncbi:MAG TPA: TIM-barrel domain-containing protein [Steroidobacteraceae bacterium]|nr:TIM-barrel domain-containing protein [Steroidobacteraceae bacterium]
MKTGFVNVALLACILATGAHAASGYEKTPDGVIITPQGGNAHRVQLQVMSERIIHVIASADDAATPAPSLMVVARPSTPEKFSITEQGDALLLKTADVTAKVSLKTGAVSFDNASGVQILHESKRELHKYAADGHDYYAIQQQFNPSTDEGFYGLGQHQNAQMNYNGEDVQLLQHNMDVAIPFVISTRDYGILWDNNSITRFGNPVPYAPVSRDLTVLDAQGRPGGFTARYYINGKLKTTRIEKDINYQYSKDFINRPAEILGTQIDNGTKLPVDAAGVTVVWEGKLVSSITGMHNFRLYAGSYFKLIADGKVIENGWRQNWNPWYHNFNLPMTAGKPVSIRVEWTPDNSYIALLHNNPLPAADRHSLWLSSEAAQAIDYYFISGNSMDDVISGYRQLTGKSVMLPRWAYGFWQSRQRYKTQSEILDVAAEYRKRHIPLDNIVEDWFYWREDDWGSHKFDPERFPDPEGMIDQLHAMNVHFMISVWPKFYPATDNYKELDAKGFIYRRSVQLDVRDWVGKNGYQSSFYDPYSKEARDMYWRQINDRLNVLGVDAWWLDASEPDIHSNVDVEENKLRIGPTAMGPGFAFYNSYPLMHTTAVYDGARAANPDKRVFILTRSAFAGQQRNASATWSGDVASRWDDLRNQISAGVNFSMSGIPNWSFDIGGFALESRYLNPTPENLEEWRELNLRWFQFGSLVPLFRSHGEEPYREIFNLAPQGSEVYNSLVWYDQLRYRLLPYIYTLAADTNLKNGSIMRGLVMDFPNDLKVRNINDEYLLGSSLLVAPVYKYHARTRSVYLPAGTRWYDFNTGKAYDGGSEVQASAPLSRMPLFVKAGAVIPTIPAIEHSDQMNEAPITLDIFTGADGQFDLYEDDGTTYGYERGQYARIPVHYDDRTHTVVIGERQGAYPGMNQKRIFNIRWIAPGVAASSFDLSPVAEVEYTGKAVTVHQ